MPPKSLKAHLLVASPELTDPNFHQSVVLLVEHSEDGALGVVLNRPLHRTIGEIWKEIAGQTISCATLAHWGGPVAGPLMVIHRLPLLADLEVLDGVYFTTDKERIDDLMRTSTDDLRFLIGCAGWGAGQLESELNEKAWEILPATAAHIFEKPDDLWQSTREQISLAAMVGPRQVGRWPVDPTLN